MHSIQTHIHTYIHVLVVNSNPICTHIHTYTGRTVECELRVDDYGGPLPDHHGSGVQVPVKQTLGAREEQTLQPVDRQLQQLVRCVCVYVCMYVCIT